MSTDLRIGSYIGGYAVESLLGRGGMSAVYLAEDPKLGRKVALKVMAEELAESDSFRTRFVREAQMAANLEHPSIVPVYDAGDSDGVLYLAMRVIRGTDLRHLITEGGGMDPDRALGILRQVASALDAAHRAGLVHRDVKPANVLIAREGDDEHAYLTDFGLTKHVSSKSGLTKTGSFMGTIDYVAPEQIRGGDVDGRTDLYSLGCVAYECLTGEVPFTKDEDVAILFAHLEDDRPKVTALRPELPPETDDVIAKAMARTPDERYESCLAFVSAAREALTVAAPRSTPATVVAAAAVIAAAPTPAEEPTLEPHPSFPPRGPSVPPVDQPVVPADASVPPIETSVPPVEAAVPAVDTPMPPAATSMPPAETSIPPMDTMAEPVVLGEVASGTTDSTSAPSAPAPVPPPPVAPKPAPAREGTAGPKRGLMIAAVVVVVAIVGGVGAMALSGGGSEPVTQPSPSVTPSQAPSPTQTPSPTQAPSPTPSPNSVVEVAPVRSPINVRGTDITSSSITLTWAAAPNGGEAVNFRILRDGVLVGQSTKTTFVDDNLSGSTTFAYQVVAVGEDGSKAASKEVSLSTEAVASTGGGPDPVPPPEECTLLDQLAGDC